MLACLGARSTKVLTTTTTIIMSNSRFIVGNDTDWRYNDPTGHFGVPVGVGYGSNARLAESGARLVSGLPSTPNATLCESAASL